MIESEEMHALGLKGHYIPACSSLSLIVISSRALRASILISEYSTMPSGLHQSTPGYRMQVARKWDKRGVVDIDITHLRQPC